MKNDQPEDQKQKAFDKRFLAYLSLVLLAGVMLYVAAVTFIPLPQTGVKYADIAVPLLLGTVIGGVVGYWFGSSNKAVDGKPPTADGVKGTP